MKKIALFSMVALFIAASFSSCGKYEEGPGISLLPKKSRLANEWKVDKYVYADGTTVTPDENNTSVMTIEKDGTFKSVNTYTVLGVSTTSEYEGTWAFEGDVNLISTVSYTIAGITTLVSDTSEIVRLTKDELAFKDDDGDYSYYVTNN